VGAVKAQVKILRRKAVVRWTRALNATSYQVRVRRPGKKFTPWHAVTVRKYTVRTPRAGKKYGGQGARRRTRRERTYHHGAVQG
jgi:hypothetical protein